MRFLQPEWLWLTPVVIVVLLIASAAYVRRRRRLAEVFGGAAVGRRLTGVDLHRLPYGRLALLLLAGTLAAVAMAEPRSRNAAAATPGEPWEVLLAVDISRSMQATDVPPTRLAAAREILPQLLEPLRNQRVGLLLFAGETYQIAPPTLDHDVLRFFIDGIDPELVSENDEGTVYGSLFTQAAAIFDRDQTRGAGGRALILLTDGDVHEEEGEVVQQVRELSRQGVRVFTIGIGTTQGSGLTLPNRPGRWGGPLLNDDGTPVITRLDEGVLQRVASAGNGRYASAASPGEMTVQMRALAALPESSARAGGGWLRGNDVVFWAAALAFLLLVLESLAHNRWRVPRLHRPVYRPLDAALKRV